MKTKIKQQFLSSEDTQHHTAVLSGKESLHQSVNSLFMSLNQTQGQISKCLNEEWNLLLVYFFLQVHTLHIQNFNSFQ